MSLSTTIKSLQDIMRKDAGIDGDGQRIGQLGWLIFLKIYSDLELEAQLVDPKYVSPVPDGLHWHQWADQASLGKDALTGEALLEFIEGRLFPELSELDLDAMSGRTRERGALLRSVFEGAYNYMKNGTLLRQLVNKLDTDLDFNDSKTRHLLGELYEQILKDMQGAGNSGEFYTPRAATEFAVEMIAPELGEIVLDPASGTGGFLGHAYEALAQQSATPEELELAKSSIRGVEKKALPHLLCTTNMMIHGIEVPSGIRHDNTLARPLRDYGPTDLVDVVVTNPPFVGMEEDGIENNFPADVRTRETAHLFVALLLTVLKPSGRAAIVLPDSFLFGEGVPERLRLSLLRDCNLHTIVRLPHGVFSPYTDIRTNILFFDRTGPTEDIWFFEVPAPSSGGKFTKTQPISRTDFDLVRAAWNDRREGPHAWKISADEAKQRPFTNLDLENPNQADPRAEYEQRSVRLQADMVEADERWQELATSVADMELDSPSVSNFMSDMGRLRERVQLTSGFVEDFRIALTQLALRGGLRSGSAPQEESKDLLETMRVRDASEIPRSYAPPFDLPPTWTWTQIGQIADFSIGKTPKTKEPSFWTTPDDPSGSPFISISDMPRRGAVTATERAVTTKGVELDIKRPPVPNGTLLMAFKLSVGKTAISELEGAFFNEAIAAIDIEDDSYREFLLWALPALARYGAKNPAVRGATLNKKSIQALWVPIPPRADQVSFVGRLSHLCAAFEAYSSTHERVRTTAGEAFKLLADSAAIS